MKKSSKQFTLTNEAKNNYGFKVLTSGIDLSHFRNNPLMLWMHTRASSGSKHEVLPLGFWEDIKVEGSRVTAIPVFDDNDQFALSIYNKVENGTLRMASAGLVPLVWNQDKQVLESSIMKEASIVDIGANSEALSVALYDRNQNLLNLKDAATAQKTISITAKNALDFHTIQKLAALSEKSWDDLHKTNQLEQLLKDHPDIYRLKFKEKFGKECQK